MHKLIVYLNTPTFVCPTPFDVSMDAWVIATVVGTLAHTRRDCLELDTIFENEACGNKTIFHEGSVSLRALSHAQLMTRLAFNKPRHRLKFGIAE